MTPSLPLSPLLTFIVGGMVGWLVSRRMPPSARTNTRVALNIVLGSIISFLVAALLIVWLGLNTDMLTAVGVLISWVVTFLTLTFTNKLVPPVSLSNLSKMTRPRAVHVFISYRREDTGGYAGRIFDR